LSQQSLFRLQLVMGGHVTIIIIIILLSLKRAKELTMIDY
jgi:hypothetical protein